MFLVRYCSWFAIVTLGSDLKYLKYLLYFRQNTCKNVFSEIYERYILGHSKKTNKVLISQYQVELIQPSLNKIQIQIQQRNNKKTKSKTNS